MSLAAIRTRPRVASHRRRTRSPIVVLVRALIPLWCDPPDPSCRGRPGCEIPHSRALPLVGPAPCSNVGRVDFLSAVRLSDKR